MAIRTCSRACIASLPLAPMALAGRALRLARGKGVRYLRHIREGGLPHLGDESQLRMHCLLLPEEDNRDTHKPLPIFASSTRACAASRWNAEGALSSLHLDHTWCSGEGPKHHPRAKEQCINRVHVLMQTFKQKSIAHLQIDGVLMSSPETHLLPRCACVRSTDQIACRGAHQSCMAVAPHQPAAHSAESAMVKQP